MEGDGKRGETQRDAAFEVACQDVVAAVGSRGLVVVGQTSGDRIQEVQTLGGQTLGDQTLGGQIREDQKQVGQT